MTPKPLVWFLLAVLYPSSALHAAESPPALGQNAISLFDGKTMAGWEGNAKLWRIEEGCLTGGSLTETVQHNDFLATTANYDNFIVRFKIKLTGAGGFINSGFQIRAERDPKSSEMIGYQCDYGDPTWWGCIYDESRRNKVMAQSDMSLLEPVLKRNDWNEYVIRADGPRVTTWINGVMGVDYFEADHKIIQNGKMGIQVHGGGKALVQVKDIFIEKLPAKPQPQQPAEPKKAEKASPLSPEEQKATFSLPPGFEMELVAAEEEANGVGKFIAVQFDQKGRLWTMTALEYPVDANENPAAADALYASKAKDKVLVYDRVADLPGQPLQFAKQARVYTDGLAIPLGILPYKDGCYVQHGHDLAFVRDTDGDGRGDKREVVLTGFGVQDSHLFPHQFTRAPGGWIWMAQGAFNYGKVVGPEGKSVQFDMTRMAKFRPDGSEFTITSNGPCNIWGLVMNAEGETFIQEANDFGYPLMPFHEYANYPGCSNSLWKSYAPEFPSTAEFRMGGTGLSGLCLTDAAGAYPPEWSDVMLVANPITNKIQAIKMHRDPGSSSGWKLQLLPDFVITSDPWFRPVAMTLGPDGCVYIVDWYNKIISHNEVPRNHPERDKKRGRIWRVKHSAQKCFAMEDFTTASEKTLIGTLGSNSLAQSHLAWQALSDRGKLSAESIATLKEAATADTTDDAKRIQAMWVLQSHLELGTYATLIQSLANHSSNNVRSEAKKGGLNDVKDTDPIVRAVSINANAALLGVSSPEQQERALRNLIASIKPALPGPTAPSSQSGKPIKVGAAYHREFERYLVRLHLEKYPQQVASFLDSAGAKELPAEALMLASLSLPPKDSAPRVAALLASLGRAPSDEEILRLAEAPEAPQVQQALQQLVSSTTGLETLLRLKAKFDARSLTTIVEGQAKSLLGKEPALALKVISSFTLKSLEPEVASMAGKSVAALQTLKVLGSTRSDLFLPLAKDPDPSLRAAALACLTSTPERLLHLWPDLSRSEQRQAAEALAITPNGASALVTAFNAGKSSKEIIDGPLVETLQAVLKGDEGLKQLLASMHDLFRSVLSLDGRDDSWVDTNLTLAGPFTVETWIKLDPGIGNEDGLLGAPGVLDINFYGGKLRVWVSQLNDIIVANKSITAGAWTHIAVTRDEKGAYKLYLNGELDQAEGKADPRPYQGLAVGRTNAPQGTKAQFAEYRVWKNCQSADEIRQLFDRTDIAREIGHKPSYYQPIDAAWNHLHGSARMMQTMDFPAILAPAQAEAVEKRFAHFRSLAQKPGDVAKGKIAAGVCIACHKFGSEGGQIGPNLSAVGAMGQEAVLRNLLTPNAAMEPGYRIYRAELKDGSVKEGFLVSQDDKAYVFRSPGLEDQRIPADQVVKGSFSNRSLMPEGLPEAMTPEMFTDLMAYLMSLK